MRRFGTVVVSIMTAVVVAGFWLPHHGGVPGPTQVRAERQSAMVDMEIHSVDPPSGQNDLDVDIVIGGSGFISGASAVMGDIALSDVTVVSATRLTAVVPWGTAPGVYSVTVTNPAESPVTLSNAFTVTLGIGVWTAGSLDGGRVEQVLISPADPGAVYAAVFDLGLFRSRDGGTSWTYVWAGTAGHVALDLLDADRLYSQDARSVDGGLTWSPMSAFGMPYPHPSVPGRTYMASNDYTGGPHLWRSDNYGVTWNEATTGLTDTQVSGLVFDPSSPDMLYVGTVNGNLFGSTNAGNSWHYIAKPLDSIGALAINPRDPYEVWASSECFSTINRTVRSTNHALTAWEPLTTAVGSAATIAFAPIAWGEPYSETVYLAGCFNTVARSMDDGVTWASGVFVDYSDYHASLALHPTQAGTLFVSSSRVGVEKSVDAGASWDVTNRGIAAVVPKRLVSVPDDPASLYAMTENGLYLLTQGGATWALLNGDLTDAYAVDAETPSRVYATSGTSYAWDLVTSDDGGWTWQTTATVSTTAPYADYNVTMPTMLIGQPGTPSTLLASLNLIRFGNPWLEAGAIYRSTDSGAHWTRATIDGAAGVDSPVGGLTYDGLTPTTVYALSNGSGTLRSTDGGQTWQRVGASIGALDHVDALAAEPVPPYRIYAASDHGNGIYISSDHGDTWQLAPSGLFGHWVNEMRFTGDTPPRLYAATHDGLFYTTDGAVGWSRSAGALGQMPALSLAATRVGDRSVLYVGSSGGSLPGIVTARLALTDPVAPLPPGVYRYTAVAGEAGSDLPWEQANANGFGSPENASVAALAVYGDRLYAGTWRTAGSAQVWRTLNGRSWSQVVPSWGVSNTNVSDMEAFRDYLYVGTQNEQGGELWRTNGVTWTPVAQGGFGDAKNTGMDTLAVFSDTLYVATANADTGPEIWRSASGDAGSWVPVANGLGGVMDVYQGHLYVGTSAVGGAALWRSGDGLTWTPVFTNGLGEANTHVAAMAEFDGAFYIGTRNVATGGQVWRSADGLQWTPVFKYGLGNPDNQRVYGLVSTAQQPLRRD